MMPGSLLQPVDTLVCCALHAVDGEIGAVEDFYFDDVSWAVRYLVVNTGGWLMERRVLISPVAVDEVRKQEKTIFIELTRAQIEHSPPFDNDRPVSRPYEVKYYEYYDWPEYWESDLLSGAPPPPVSPEMELSAGETGQTRRQKMHLHRTAQLNGYVIVSHDGAIALVRDAIVDTRYWVIRYLEIQICRGRPARHVLVSPCWIERVNWVDRVIKVGLASAAITTAPGFDPSRHISRDYEVQLFRHYGRRGYWQRDNETTT
jgi:hypothetical protein